MFLSVITITLQDFRVVELLIQILRENVDALDDLQFNPQKMSVLTNVVGALSECGKVESNVEIIRSEGGLEPLIKLISTNGPGIATFLLPSYYQSF